MKLNAKVLKGIEITQAVIPANGSYPERKGWKLDGYYLNGSDKWATKDELLAALEGEELSPSASGKSLVVVGAFTPAKSENLAKLLVKRETVELTIDDLNDLI